MKNELDKIKVLKLDHLHAMLSEFKDDSWNFWQEFNGTSGCYNVGIFIYDEDMYHFAEFAQRGGLITGSKVHLEKLRELGYNPTFHSWYQDNVFIQIATIPSKIYEYIRKIDI